MNDVTGYQTGHPSTHLPMSEDVAALQHAEKVRLAGRLRDRARNGWLDIPKAINTHKFVLATVTAETFRSDGCGYRHGLQHQTGG